MKLNKRDILHVLYPSIIGFLIGGLFSLLILIKRDTTLILNAQENIVESMKETETSLELETEPSAEETKVEELETEVETEKETEPVTEEPTRHSVYSNFTPEEIYLIQRCVETETFQADIDSKTNVASVIFNRYKDGRFGESITEIITTAYQFAYHRTEISEETIEAIERAWDNDTTYGALYFHSNPKTDTFCGANFIFQDSVGHNFYK